MSLTLPKRLFALALMASFCFAADRARGMLQPDQLLLITNANVPAGRKMAEAYAKARHVPEGRILELPLKAGPGGAPLEEMTAFEYEERVAPAVRAFLTKNNLDRQVTCLVTFWGMPLRIGRRSLTPVEARELADVKKELADETDLIREQVKTAEQVAHDVDAEFHPGGGDNLDALSRRADLAVSAIIRGALKITDAKKRAEIYDRMMAFSRDLGGQPAISNKLSEPDFWPLATTRPTTDQIIASRQRTADLQKQVNAALSGPQDVQSRAKLRELFRKELGSLNLARLAAMQIQSLDVAESEAALDNELALLWWPPYPKARWALNPLYWRYAGKVQLPAHTLMVCRLDGPTEDSVYHLMTTSMTVESEGLKGEVVIDARGKAPVEPYGEYDQTLRNLAQLLRAKTSLKVVLDDRESLIPRDSENQIAVYCGWYSLRHYVSPGTFAPGAVAFHIASLEMVSLHREGEGGWCHNLMNAGVVATLGPVAEPYLQSFPPADEFFPLLMTGKMSLAEVYWDTLPWASWMQCCVGDPLYLPYKVNPPLATTDLPEALKPALR